MNSVKEYMLEVIIIILIVAAGIGRIAYSNMKVNKANTAAAEAMKKEMENSPLLQKRPNNRQEELMWQEKYDK